MRPTLEIGSENSRPPKSLLVMEILKYGSGVKVLGPAERGRGAVGGGGGTVSINAAVLIVSAQADTSSERPR
jgi:hypothetical protein